MQPKEKPTPAFDLKVFLTKTHGRTKRADYAENALIFSQGDPADAVSIAAKNGAILAGEKEPWCGLRNGLL